MAPPSVDPGRTEKSRVLENHSPLDNACLVADMRVFVLPFAKTNSWTVAPLFGSLYEEDISRVLSC